MTEPMDGFTTRRLTGWGRWPAASARVAAPEDLRAFSGDVALTRGLGRSYGDAAVPSRDGALVLETLRANRILSFDATSGRLRAEAGLALDDLKRLLLPRGWFVPVTPGTSRVTLGGMAAADVHGKNHHVAGSFGRHVQRLVIHTPARGIIECSREAHPDLFRATIGGMGLTGCILEVDVSLERVPSPWVVATSSRFATLEGLIDALREAGRAWPFTVAWADMLAPGAARGRGVLLCGRWAEPDEAPPAPPPTPRAMRVRVTAPDWLLGGWSMRAFNRLYLLSARRRSGGAYLVHPDAFFYPLDRLDDWNRLYGSRGFTQHQCVLPGGEPSLCRRFVDEVAASGARCFLCVIKDCGDEGEGLLSFPLPGVSFALDLPLRDARTHRAVERLSRFVADVGGRIYLAKDALTPAETFREMEPRLAEWQRARRTWDPEGRLSSALSRRLLDAR